MELSVGSGTVKSLWVRVKGQRNNVDVTVAVHCRTIDRTMMPVNYSLSN